MPDDIRLHDLADPEFPPGFAEQVEAVKPLAAQVRLEAAPLIEQAMRETGLDDFGPDGWQERLELLLRALRDDVALSPLGILSNAGQITQFLKNRLLFEDLVRRHPESLETPMDPPIVIAGLPRSGTTHLHSLIAADPRFRSLPWWEALEPVLAESEKVAPGEEDPRRTRAAAGIEARDQVLPHFNAMHEMTVDHTHEEIHLLAIDFGTMFFENLGVGMLPTWRDYYLGSDQTPHYQYVARMLRALQWLRGGRRWVLKSPQHLEQFDAILATYPEATVAVTHRDPVSTVASFATMISYSTRMSAAKPDPVGLGHYWADRIETMLRRCVETRDRLPAAQSTDVLFHEYMGHELETARTIYGQAGLELDDASLAAIDAYQQAHPRGRYGRVLYDLADFDLDPAELRERFRFYTDRFPVRLEH